MKESIVIDGKSLCKQYLLGSDAGHHDTLRDLLAHKARSFFRRNSTKASEKSEFWALKDVSFEIRQGENVGIIGLNGAGKSTLLKILSRITLPTAGTARVVGRVGALLEVGTGFHQELTGRENTYLYGAILGMGREEISRKFEAIVEFAGIRDFIDTPVKRYSSGMYVRLAFAVAAHLEPEILLLDEVLSVGDLPFQRKCMEFTKQLQKRNATILFVSHNMSSIKTMCSRVIYLKNGHVWFDGPTDTAIGMYEEDCRLSSLSWSEVPKERPINVTGLQLCDESGSEKTVFDHGERMLLHLEYEASKSVDNPNFIIAFVRADGVACCSFCTETDGVNLGVVRGKGSIELLTPPVKLVSELYTVSILVREPGFQQLLCAQIGTTFHVRHELYDTHFGVFHESGTWSIETGSVT